MREGREKEKIDLHKFTVSFPFVYFDLREFFFFGWP